MKASNPQKIVSKATSIFTDREEPRAAFWRLYHAMEPDEIEVINYYGVGGIGKSTLLKQLQLELSEHGNEKYVEYNFENKKAKDMILYDLSRQLMKKCKGLSFPVFDYAFEKYKVCIGEEYLKCQLLEEENILEHHLVGSAFSVVGDYVPFVGTVSSVITEGSKAILKIAKKHEQLKGSKAELYNEISEINSAQTLFNKLQYYFAIDAFSYFDGKKEAPLVVMLDGYEVFVNRLERGDKAIGDDLWLREEGSLLMSIPNTIWVIAGREKLEWDKDILPQDQTHLIGNLSEMDASDFFKQSGVDDEELIRGLYSLTSGTPVYMDLCVKQYKNLKAQNIGYMPCLTDFGKNTEEIAVRFLRDMTIMEQGIMHLLSCMPNTWNDYYVTELAKKLCYDFSQNEYRLIKEMTLVEEIDSEGEFYRLHETFRRVVYSEIREDEKKRILNGLKDILVSRMAASEVTVEELQYAYVSCVDLLVRASERLMISMEDVRRISWVGFKCSMQNVENIKYLEQLEEVFLQSKENDALQKYVRCAEMHTRSLFYFEKDQKALKVAERVMEKLHMVSDIDEETRIRGYCLYGWQLFNMDRNKESLEILEQAYALSQGEKELPYACRKNVLDKLLQVIYSFCEDNTRYNKVAQEYIDMCKKERIRLQNEKETYENHSRMNRIKYDEAQMLVKVERYEEALELHQSILNIYEKEERSVNELCDCRSDIAKIYFYMNRYDEALEIFMQVLEAYKKNEADALDISSICGEIRDCYLCQEENEQALKYAIDALEFSQKGAGENSLSVAEEKLHLAEIYNLLNHREEAEICYLDCVAIKSQLLGSNHTETCGAKGYLAQFYTQIGAYEKSYQMWQELYLCYADVYGKSHKETLYALYRTGDYFYFTEDYENARRIQEMAYHELVQKEDRGRMDIVNAARQLASTCVMLGDLASAKIYAEKALTLLEDESYPDLVYLYDSYIQCAGIYGRLAEYESSLNVIQKCLELVLNHEDVLGDRYWNVYMQLGDTLGEAGENERALEIHKEILAHYEEVGEAELEIEARLSMSIDLDALGRAEEALETDILNYERAKNYFGVDSEQALTYYDFVASDLEALGRREEAESIRNYVESKQAMQEM